MAAEQLEHLLDQDDVESKPRKKRTVIKQADAIRTFIEPNDECTIHELAFHRKLSVRHIKHMKNNFGLPFIQKGSRIRFTLASYDKWLAQRRKN